MNNTLKQNYIHYLQTGKNLIFRADFHIIGGCNFKCIMCDNGKSRVELNFSDSDILETILSLKKDYNCNYIRFHGQEPTLYKNLENIILFSKKLGMRVSIKTNGWLMDDKRLIKILKSGLDELYLSIDGPNSIIHDKIRGVRGSFDKNIDIISKSKKIKPDLKIYINSVVLNLNFHDLDKMVDLGFKYGIDRASFVLLNDKNTKKIKHINLTKKDFFLFFSEKILAIYKKSKLYNIHVDFSPFFGNLSGKSVDYIISELENNFKNYEKEIGNFYEGLYGKTFYDKYGCFGPIDHTSINYTGDMYGCCVVERDSLNAIGNIIKDDLGNLWSTEKYKKYRDLANSSCSYAGKCASNFYNRKLLFKDIYLDDNLYPKNDPLNYYRYLKELYHEDETVLENTNLEKLKGLLLHFYDNLVFYRKLLIDNDIKRQDIYKINSLEFIKKLPILNKKILKENGDEIKKMSAGRDVLHGSTSGNSGDKLAFCYPLDFKRYVRQIAIFSEETDFIYSDSYFSITPINCNQKIINNIQEPDYVKKIYITITEFNFKKEQFLKINDNFIKNKHVNFIHADPKYVLYIILGFKKFGLKLPHIKAIFLTYSYLNKSLRDYIKKEFSCNVLDNYGCSEVGPISLDNDGRKKIFGDNIILEEIDAKIVLTDLDNDVFPFLRYENGDKGIVSGKMFDIVGKAGQTIHGKTLRDMDDFFYGKFKNILFYQFDGENFYYFSKEKINNNLLQKEMQVFLDKTFKMHIIGETSYFKVGTCSKFRTII